MTEQFSHFLIALSAVFFVVDPIGLVPLFVSMTGGDPPEKVRNMALRACVVACGLLLFFALFGGLIFKVFGVSLAAFRIAGGILLLITALDMLKARTSETRATAPETKESAEKEDIALVPLAIPLLAGPGSIATVMVLMSRGDGGVASTIPVIVAVVITFLVTYLMLRGATLVQRILKASGVAILERVMGLLLAAIAVQFVADGVRDLIIR